MRKGLSQTLEQWEMFVSHQSGESRIYGVQVWSVETGLASGIHRPGKADRANDVESAAPECIEHIERLVLCDVPINISAH